MIQILLFILKLVGWILLGILGLILGILLLVLFCAVRYRVEGKKEDKLEGRVCITWLFRIISLVVGYQNSLSVQAKLFGITVWKLEGKDKGGEEPKEEGIEEPEETGTADKNKETDKKGKAGKTKEQEKADQADALLNQLNALEAEREKLLAEQKAEEEAGRAEGKGPRKASKFAKKKAKKGPVKADAAEKKSLWEKIAEKITAWIEKLRFSFSQICDKLRQIEEKKQWLLEKWDGLSEMICDPANQASVRLILRQVKKIIGHILPRKGSAALVFGREDPYLMGKVLSYAGFAYPFTHKFLTLSPVFGEDKLEGEVHIRGRIRLGVILGYVLRLLFNKNIRQKLRRLYGR